MNMQQPHQDDEEESKNFDMYHFSSRKEIVFLVAFIIAFLIFALAVHFYPRPI